MVSYSLPGRPNRQLTKSDLGSFDRKLLNSIEAVAKSALYLENIRFHNDLILDTLGLVLPGLSELSDSSRS